MDIKGLIGIAGIVLLFLLIIIRIPVALAMFLVGIIGSFFLGIFSDVFRFEAYLLQFKSALWNSVANFELSIIPIFLLMGFLATEIGLSKHLFQGMQALVGRIRGGVALAVIAACAAFGAVSGSSIATASTMGKISLPELQKLKYDESLSAGVIAAGGTLGILIPPSVALVLYAVTVEISILSMFQAAILPAILAIVFFAVVVLFLSFKNPRLAPKSKIMSKSEYWIAIKKLLPVLLLFSSIILGLGIGIFTPTPAAAMGVFLVIVYGLFIRNKKQRGINWLNFKSSIYKTAKVAGMIYFIIFAADILKGFFARTGLPAFLSTFLGNSGYNPFIILLAMLFILIVLGFFMESLSMILVIIPFFWPVLIEINGGSYISASEAAFGMTTEDLKIWFGILVLVIIELGLITPPVGLNIFVIKSLSKAISSRKIAIGIIPFFIIEIFRILLLVAFPSLSLQLPAIL